MNAEAVSLRVVEILNKHQIPYMLVGSLSTNFHSIVRSTKDADFVVPDGLAEAARTIAREYPTLVLDPQFGFQSVTGTKKLILRASDSGGFIVELFGPADDPHDIERFRRRMKVDWLGRPTWIATAEDAIVTKLRWGHLLARAKDVADVQTVIAIQRDALDWPYIERWCDEHGSRPLLEKIRAELQQHRAGGGP
jgi:hypothetical protein